MMLWDPPRFFFQIPSLGLSIGWYGLLFAFGFFIAYLLLKYLLTAFLREEHPTLAEPHKTALSIADNSLLALVAGILVGARLVHVLFYDWPFYQRHPWEILKLWQGGLASHGAVLGCLLSLALLYRLRSDIRRLLPPLAFVDMLALVALPVGCCIRIGNFFNQEILGLPTQRPWGVLFLHPLPPSEVVPRHPVQLYEALFYVSLFGLLAWAWKERRLRLGQGIATALVLLGAFGFRFGIEFLKEPQSQSIDETHWRMGQWLTLPFLLGGLALALHALFKPKRRKDAAKAVDR